MEECSKIYPELQEADGNNFRLYQIAKYLSKLEKELQNREDILKKYKRVNSILIKMYFSWWHICFS